MAMNAVRSTSLGRASCSVLRGYAAYSLLPCRIDAISRASTTQQNQPDLPRLLPKQPSRRPFARQLSTTPPLLKKKNKVNNATDDKSSKQSKASPTTAEDPFDLTPLQSDLTAITTKLKTDLSTLRSGGRFNPSVLETLRVQPAKESKTTYPLSDLAQIVPRSGRELHILVSDPSHVKPVSSAIQSSNLNLTPQPDAAGQNATTLVIQVPPPTAESRRVVVEQAGRMGEAALAAVREARGKQQKKFRRADSLKTVRPDDSRREHARMEEVVKKVQEEVKKVVDGAKKALDS